MPDAPSEVLQVGLPDDFKTKLKSIRNDTEWFANEQDVYRCAVAVAIAHNWRDEEWFKKPLEVKDKEWRTVLLDKDGSLKRLIEILAPECQSAPYKYSQFLARAGVNYLYQELVEKHRKLTDVLDLASMLQDDQPPASTPSQSQ